MTAQTLVKGTPVQAINGTPAQALIAQLEQFSHGETALLRTHMLSVMLPAWLSAAMGWQGAFEIEVGPSDSTTTVRWTPEEAWLPKDSAPRDLPLLSWPKAHLALLKIPTFDVDEDPLTFGRAIEEAFATIHTRHATGLVIDVRGNTGGQSDAGAAVIRQFLTRPVVQVSRARERLNEDNNEQGSLGQPGQMREFDLGEEGIEPVVPEKRFGGPVVVLIDELTYSAGILFATTMQDHRLAILAGRPTGGFANQTGNMMPSRLPNTGFTGFIATREFVRPNGDLRQQPVTPDIQLEDEPTAEQLAGMVQEAGQRLMQTDQAE
ncbi:S41 family peptidase [Brevundimonas sp.]